jgi:hypothetical protein
LAVSNLHAAPAPQKSSRQEPGPITAGLLNLTHSGLGGSTPFGGIDGPDAAGMILLRAHALTACLSAAFNTTEVTRHDEDNQFNLLIDSYKALAMEGIGDLILLAKVLVDEA